MKTQIDLKSALLGIGVGVLAVLAMGAATSSNEIGRYQIAGGQGCLGIIDSKTGQAWGYCPTSTAQFKIDENFWNAK